MEHKLYTARYLPFSKLWNWLPIVILLSLSKTYCIVKKVHILRKHPSTIMHNKCNFLNIEKTKKPLPLFNFCSSENCCVTIFICTNIPYFCPDWNFVFHNWAILNHEFCNFWEFCNVNGCIRCSSWHLILVFQKICW